MRRRKHVSDLHLVSACCVALLDTAGLSVGGNQLTLQHSHIILHAHHHSSFVV